ncbi:hypothetical protein GH741_15275 [Aquibacillus halophilus]|uniref:Uncharacterized protein n=1 Tax=Aquibacillus halophilus TaxID=930132 RepID=A0A6A8DED8_9BACI|nr:hypothetical protein [Aquibacillus halophilus]MRH44003.1 hypothetical protein [Aquibacillus halophilus]
MDGFWIGVLVAGIAIVSIFFRGNNTKKGRRSNNRLFLVVGILAALIGFVGFAFLGWRF